MQAYAISVADGDKARLLEALLPGGKTLPDVLRASFDNALKKLGQSRIFENLIGALAFLPAPIAVPSITRIAGCTEETVRDFAIDLAPGLRLHDNAITIADEDFDAFIKDTGSANRNAIIADIAEDFIANLKVDPYSSIHVADALINSGRARDVLSVIERDPQAAAIGDPIVRRQVQVRRLKLSLASCKEAGPTIDALKTILISAEAERDESTLNEVLEKELDLSVEFAGSSLRRAILLDRERVEEHGSFLAQDAVRAIRTGNRVTAREQLYFYDAWLKRRQKVKEEELENGWAVTDLDISARVETILELAGPKTALRDLMGWSPRTVSLRVSYILVPQLIAAGKKHHLKALLDEGLLSGPWDLLLWVPLAMAGESVNGLTIEKSLRRIRRCFIPQVGAHRGAYSEEGWQENLLDTFVTACELAFKLGVDKQAILKPVNLILEVLEGKQQRHLFASDVNRLNGLLRCWLLKETICGGSAKDDSFIAYVKTLKPEPKTKEQRNNKAQKKRIGIHQTDNQEVERLNRKIQALFPVYSARLEILDCVREKQQITEKHLNKLGSISSHSYDFDYDPDGTSLRNMAAQNVMNLLIVDNITASDLAHRASSLAQGRFGDSFAHRRKKLWAKMRLRESEAEKLVLLVAKAAEDIKGLREASSEKLSAIIDLSRLILPISRDDAKSLFDDAIGIAKDIDQEAYDQIDFVSVLADRARVPELVDRIKIAANIFAFVSGAAERLSGRDEFPWRPAVHALTCVDDAASLAAICRWADDGTAKLDYTLDRFLLTGLQKNIISLEEATSLTMLIDGSHGDLRKEIVSRSAADPQKFKKIIEEVAKEALLFSSQDKRLPLGQEIVDRISQNDISDGEWITKLRDTVSFLRQATSNKPEKATTIRSEMVQRLVKDDDLPKKFIFEPQGNSFTTPDSIAEILQAAKTSGLRHDDRDILNKMRNVSSSPRDRVPFLNAVAGVSEDLIWSRLDLIRDTLALWKGTPAVDRWCRESLPLVLIAHFDAATRWLKGGQSILHHLLDYTGLDVNSRLQIILAGVAQVGEALSSRTLFAIAEEIARTLNKDDAGKQLFWYSERLLNRLPAEDQALYVLADIPNDRTEAIARFLFALMSDIDTRVRWKTAHALRRMAKLGRSDIVKATILQSGRVKDVAFRIPSGPFYFLAAKLWLTISLYRISVETPEALKSCKAQVFDLATSSELPHIGIREYAKRTLLQLASGGAISLTADESTVIEQINTALKGRMTDKKDTYRSFRDPQEKRRFRFDAMDTLPYWYEDILRIFPTVSQDQILDIAERWIVDKWGAGPEAHWWDKEPRKGRYDERRYALWSHSHGSFPIVERYGTHLEWHAMHCVVGELLTTHQILNEDEDEFGSFGYWLRKILLTEPPYWLSDNRGATPLEHRLWLEDSRTDRGWLHSVRRDEFLTEIGAHSQIRTGWIVVEGYYSIHFPKREVNVRINSALVSPKTANSLVCALQTASDPWDFRLPDENDNMQIDEPPYQLLGWLTRIESDMRFDENDPFRYEVRQIRGTPGLKLSEALGLVQKTGNPRTWVCSSTGEAAFLYEAWCDEPSPEDDYYPRRIRSDGWRLWAKADIVRSFFTNEGWDLICEVQIERRLKNEYGRSYDTDEKKKTHDKILLLRADGSIADTKGHIGTWTGLSQATQS